MYDTIVCWHPMELVRRVDGMAAKQAVLLLLSSVVPPSPNLHKITCYSIYNRRLLL